MIPDSSYPHQLYAHRRSAVRSSLSPMSLEYGLRRRPSIVEPHNLRGVDWKKWLGGFSEAMLTLNPANPNSKALVPLACF